MRQTIPQIKLKNNNLNVNMILLKKLFFCLNVEKKNTFDIFFLVDFNLRFDQYRELWIILVLVLFDS